MWKRWLRRVLLLVVMVLSLLLIFSWWVSHQTQQVPEFYEQAVVVLPPEELAESSEQLEADVEQLQADVQSEGRWEATFEVEQINAWLAAQLPIRFPKLKARGLEDPRIQIREETMQVAARVNDARFNAVLSVELQVQLTDQPNRLAIIVKTVRAGALPLPLSQFQSRIKRLLEPSKLNLTWDALDGETVALVDVPDQYPGYTDQPIIIESIGLSDGKLTVAGRTGEDNLQAYSPAGRIYRL